MNSQRHIAFDDIVESLEKNRDRIALIDKEGKRHTYGEFKQQITGARAELVKHGVQKDSKVLVFVTMSMELYAILEALFSLGAKTIFLDPWMKGRKMGAIINQVEPDLLILNTKAARFSWLLPATWKLKKWKVKAISPNNDDWKIAEVKDDDSALITFTSGTTGTPKGANRTYSFIDAQAKALKERLQGETNSINVDYTNLPIVALAGFAIGNTVVIPKINLMKVHKANPLEIVDHLKEVGVTRMVVSPSLLKKVLIGIKGKGNASIKEIVTGGAPITNSLIKDCIENHANIEFESIYGSTEVEPISSATMKEIYTLLDEPLRGIYVGEPVEEIVLKVLKPTEHPVDSNYFEQHQLGEDEIGEIVVTGDHVNKNYYENPEAFAKYKIVDVNGTVWHRTGDIGYLEKGKLYLVGRDHRIMEKDGKKHFPFPIEQFVEREFDCTDVGYVQKKNGEFVLYLGPTEKSITDQILEKIKSVGYPCDKIVVKSKELPRDPRHRSKLQIETLI